MLLQVNFVSGIDLIDRLQVNCVLLSPSEDVGLLFSVEQTSVSSIANDFPLIPSKWSLLLFQGWSWIKAGGEGVEKSNPIIPLVMRFERPKERF